MPRNTLLLPVSIKKTTFKNRLFKAASWENLADDQGHMTPELFAIYDELAQGGVGGILTGYAYVTPDEKPNAGMMGIYEDSFIPEYQELTARVHQHDARIVIQLAYGGSMSTLSPPSEKILGPSAIPNEATGITPQAMTRADMEYLIDCYAQAARRAEAAGFDGAQLHGAHGYMLSHMLSGDYNQRDDEYGGSIENRARLWVEIVRAMRAAVSPDFLLLVKMNSEDFTPQGLTQDEALVVARLITEAGIDCIEVSGGNSSSRAVLKGNLGTSRSRIKSLESQSYFAPFAKRLATTVDIPIILTGGNRHLQALEQLHLEGDIDFFALCRPLISEPDLVSKWYADETYLPRCSSCNGCFRTEGKRCMLDKNK